MTANRDGSCLLVEFEDIDASVWETGDKPNYVDAIFWVYPSSPGFDIS